MLVSTQNSKSEFKVCCSSKEVRRTASELHPCHSIYFLNFKTNGTSTLLRTGTKRSCWTRTPLGQCLECVCPLSNVSVAASVDGTLIRLSSSRCFFKSYLGGGFKSFLMLTPKHGEMIQFDLRTCFKGVGNKPPSSIYIYASYASKMYEDTNLEP